MIFLSHTATDKPVIEPLAMQLRDILGQDKVFYDSWSIQPGDGIIDKMNEGLETPSHVFFFVSEASLKSEMVKLEWQNALYRQTQGKTKLIPIRLGSCDMPALLSQTVWLDMQTNGIDATVRQIIELVQGVSAFTPAHQEFSNLTYSLAGNANSTIEVTVTASHLTETQTCIGFALANDEKDVRHWIKGHPGVITMPSATVDGTDGANPIRLLLIGGSQFQGSIKPGFPVTHTLTTLNGVKLELAGVVHQVGHGQFKPIPHKQIS